MTTSFTSSPKKLALLTFFNLVLFSIFANLALAATPNYEPLVGLPGLTDQKNASLSEYFNVIYLTVIGLGALVGVVKIAMAGVKYSMSDVVTNKESARHDIMGVLLGLAILLIPFIVLNTIYGNLTNLNVLDRAQGLKLQLDPSRAKTNQASQPAPVSGNTLELNLIRSCTAMTNSQWDFTCKKCILKSETPGSTCNAPPLTTTVSCSSYTLTPPMTCQTFCTQTLHGTFSSSAMTCTYGGGG